MELTILMPCLNESASVVRCIREAKNFLESRQIQGEILIADNGSADGSQQLARDAGARVITVPEKGYGYAIRGGIAEAKGRFVYMGNAVMLYEKYLFIIEEICYTL
jgi:glycosyltransferase involved in cell wall biosynthesis